MMNSTFKPRIRPVASLLRTANLPDPKPRKRSLKTSQRAVTPQEKALWDRMVSEVGCIPCLMDGNINHHCSIHHIDGRTKPGCHLNVLPLCAGHHQQGTGEDKSMFAVHPYKARFEARYGLQRHLLARVMECING